MYRLQWQHVLDYCGSHVGRFMPAMPCQLCDSTGRHYLLLRCWVLWDFRGVFSLPAWQVQTRRRRRRLRGVRSGRILNAGGRNWFHAHHGGRAGVAHYNGWATSYSYIVTPNTDWVLMCSDGASKVRLYTARGVLDNGNGDKRSSDGVTGLYINGETSEKSDFAVAELITWDRPLSEVEMVQMLSHLAQQSTSSLPEIGRASCRERV